MGNIQVTDIGNYTCVASNAFGRDSKTESVLIEGYQNETPVLHPLSMPPDLGIGDSLDIVCSLKRGNIPVTFDWKFPHWTKEPMDTTAAKGSGLIVDCTSTGHPTPRVSWNRQKGTEHRENIRSEGQWSTASNGSLIFSRIDESDAGVYVCEAHNGIGPGISKSIQISVHAPPELKKKFERVTVRRGHTARLMCEITGDQPLHVSWKKDNQDVNIQFGTRFEVVKDTTDYGSKSELLIHDSQKADVGSYVCHAQQVRKRRRESEINSPGASVSPGHPHLRGAGAIDPIVLATLLLGRRARRELRRQILEERRWVQTSVKKGQITSGDSSRRADVRHHSEPAPGHLVQRAGVRQNWRGAGGPLHAHHLQDGRGRSKSRARQLESHKSIMETASKTSLERPSARLLRWEQSGPFEFTLHLPDRGDDGPPRGSLLIQGLMKATTYTIVVKAFNAAGSGPPTHELQVTTLEEDPPSPPIVGVADVTASSVGIHWNIGSDKQPSVVQYLLEFREEGEEWDHIHLPGERNSFYLTGLKGSTRYELRIAAYNVFGRGEFSPTIDFTTGLAEISVPFSTTHSNTPFYFRPYFVIPVAASVVVIVTTVVIAWVCYKRMTLRQDRLLAACQPLDCRLMQARVPLQRGDTVGGYCDPVARPPSYTPPMGGRHPVGVPDDDDAYDAPWDMANPAGVPGNAQAGSYTRLKSQMPNPGGAIVIGHQSGSSR
ncbi:down syndrome cell adhesion molecule-like protein 1 homolog [Caerostris extrusa]|uniref:Down syndrome cell adhesion molecule-like protein 1 homolog n=1 Tax=Caerostris extrusa TaxID=172846 RepID=A0AAV4VS09_CAEEX|nr:down syndrome cell adhesion molecule-like protein 1 homolog [Caerostris extrusa]